MRFPDIDAALEDHDERIAEAEKKLEDAGHTVGSILTMLMLADLHATTAALLTRVEALEKKRGNKAEGQIDQALALVEGVVRPPGEDLLTPFAVAAGMLAAEVRALRGES